MPGFRIGIDAHTIGERQAGIETYITNLLHALLASESPHEFVLFFIDESAAAEWRERYPQAKVVMAHPRHPLVRIPIVMPWLMRHERLDLLHVQFAGPPFGASPLVTTIHDLSYEHHPEYFTRKEVVQLRATVRPTARRASRILTVSEFSKRDIVETYGIDPEKVVVTYDGVGSEFAPISSLVDQRAIKNKFDIKSKYFLAVGSLEPRKNLVRLITAYTRLRQVHSEIEHQLVIVGRKAWKYDPILEFARRSAWAKDILLTDYVPAADLPVLYAGAVALIYPALFEGFGLPPLEAMACGTPVIVSDQSSLPEVVGDAGIKVNPFDIDAIAAAMMLVATEPELGRRLSAAGLKRAERFSWPHCAAKTLKTYEEVLAETHKNRFNGNGL